MNFLCSLQGPGHPLFRASAAIDMRHTREAQAAGCPVYAANVSGLPFTVDTVTGA